MTGDNGEGGVCAGDDVKTERMEEGDEKRVVGIRDGMETHFIVELSSGETLHCTLPQLYSHTAGGVGCVKEK